MNHPRTMLLILSALALQAAPIRSQTVTDTFDVRISIQGTCAVLSPTDIDFGMQDPVPGTHQQNGTIAIQCTRDLPFTLGLDGGTTTGDVNARAMQNGDGVQIPYTLRRNASTGPNWGNDSTSWFTGSGEGLGTAYQTNLTVHAEATLSGNEPADVFSDTVRATLSY